MGEKQGKGAQPRKQHERWETSCPFGKKTKSRLTKRKEGKRHGGRLAGVGSQVDWTGED